MSPHSEDVAARNAAVEPVTDPETLRDRDDVPFHEDADVVDRETFETLEALDDLALVGVTNADGEVLLRRLTEDCALKMPTVAVEPGEDFTAAVRREVPANTGLDLEFESLEAVWEFEATLADDESRTTSRSFVVYAATPVEGGGDPAAIPEAREAAAAAWYDELPEETAEPPGTDLFFD